MTPSQPPKTLEWTGGTTGLLRLLDQTRLPLETVYIDCRTTEDVWQAIRRLSVRGAPAIGVAAAWGMVLGAQSAAESTRERLLAQLAETAEYLASSRPTAVNLFWAIDRMHQRARSLPQELSSSQALEELVREATAIEQEDRAMCAAIGRFGAKLMPEEGGVLTHCNAGGLATAGDGTALSVLFAAAAAGKRIHVYADETRPLLQGARLTSWELLQRNVPCTVLCDSAAAHLMSQGRIQAVVTGADRIAANGDVANKIGTLSVAMLAQAFGIPFYVAAPSSTFDFSLADGTGIPIEERSAEEVTCGFGRQTVPEGVEVANPAFDVTPASCLAGLITERGVIAPVTAEAIRDRLQGAEQQPA